MRLTLRYMRVADIQAVRSIDKLCFDPVWTTDSYLFEIRQSKVSHMVVLEAAPEPAQAPTRHDGWRRRLDDWLGQSPESTASHRRIVGYGGLWQIENEAHVSTIATHPRQRGRGYGELLLAGMIKKALRMDADYLVLEVRVSNDVALNLYRKYGFSRVGRKRNYYISDKEDAWDMRATLDESMRRRFAELYAQVKAAHGFYDDYSHARRPRV